MAKPIIIALICAMLLAASATAAVSAVSFDTADIGNLTIETGATFLVPIELDTPIDEGMVYWIRSDLETSYTPPAGTVYTHDTGTGYAVVIFSPELFSDLGSIEVTPTEPGEYIIYLENAEFSQDFLPVPIEDAMIIVHVISVGDIDGDGDVDLVDLMQVLGMMWGIIEPTDVADLNGNGYVDIGDARWIWNIMTGA